MRLLRQLSFKPPHTLTYFKVVSITEICKLFSSPTKPKGVLNQLYCHEAFLADLGAAKGLFRPHLQCKCKVSFSGLEMKHPCMATCHFPNPLIS